jgi:hypothetical protein
VSTGVHWALGVTRCQRSLWKWMMNGGNSVIVIVSNDTASCSEKLHRSNRPVHGRQKNQWHDVDRHAAKYCRIDRGGNVNQPEM